MDAAVRFEGRSHVRTFSLEFFITKSKSINVSFIDTKLLQRLSSKIRTSIIITKNGTEKLDSIDPEEKLKVRDELRQVDRVMGELRRNSKKLSI